MFQWPQLGRKRKASIPPILAQHMGGSCEEAQTITHTIKPVERVNLQLALDRWFGENPGPSRLFGYAVASYDRARTLSQLLVAHEEVHLAPVERERFPLSAREELDCVTRGVYLLHCEGQP